MKLIPFDSFCLRASVHEMQALLGYKVQAVWTPRPNSVAIELYGPPKLYVVASWNPGQFYGLGFTSQRPPKALDEDKMTSPLRSSLVGMRLLAIEQEGFDRVVVLKFSAEQTEMSLRLELKGRQTNAILLDKSGAVKAAAKTFGPRQSATPVQLGQKYVPAVSERLSLLVAKASDDLKKFEGSSPVLLALIAHLGFEQVVARVKAAHFEPCNAMKFGAYPLDVGPLGYKADVVPSLADAWVQCSQLQEQESHLANAKQSLQSQLGRVQLAREVAFQGLQEAYEAGANARNWQEKGELILAYQGQIKPGDQLLEAYNYAGEPTKIKLHADKSVAENSNFYFEKARKAKDRLHIVADQRERIEIELEDIGQLLHNLELAKNLAEVEALRDQAARRRWTQKIVLPGTKEEDKPYGGNRIKEYLAPGGYTVLLGENATANDYLVQRLGKGTDIWLHVRGQTSAHVLILTQGQPDRVQKETLIFAAKLAANNSAIKHSSHIPVDYTLKKYVRKPRGSAKGSVVYEREKTLHVDP